MAGDVTLDFVAKKAGVSRATASRALNDRAGVADDVRDRVRMVADSLSYRPNRAAKNLAGGRTSVVGLILSSSELRVDGYAASLIHAMARAAEHHDEGLMLLMSTKEPGEVVQNILRDGIVDGVVVSAISIGEQWVEELLDANLPTVLVGSHPGRNDVNVVDVESLESSAAMVGHLLDTGCDRVGMITGPMDRVDASHRLDGYCLAHQRRNLRVDDALIVHGDYSRLSGYQMAPQLLDQGVDGIFASNDEMGLGVVMAANERGLSLPDDLSLAGFDGTSSMTEATGPHLSTVLQPFDDLAMAAMRTLVALLDGDDVPRTQMLEPELSFGWTTRKPV